MKTKTTNPLAGLAPAALGPRLLLLALLCATPLLARADALDAAFAMLVGLAVVWGIALVGALFSVLAYRRPGSGVLRVFNILFIVIGLGLGVLWERIFNGSSSAPIGLNPFLSFSLLLALWLGGVRQAQAAGQPGRRLLWVSLAVLGATSLFSTLCYALLRAIFGLEALYGGPWLVRELPQLLAAFAAWWLVLGQVQRARPLGWHRPPQWVLPPAVVAGLGLLLQAVFLGIALSSNESSFSIEPVSTLLQALPNALPAYAVGVLAIWLNQRRYPAPAAG